MTEKYIKPERINLKAHQNYDERWVQNLIEKDPSIIGLGDLDLRDKERVQPRSGRLDLLFQDPETKRRYEVELQLGATDESHIIRTIEYYDIEKRRYPQYEHCAVLIAEDITSRFLNVVSLFNGTLPLIAIQMQAYKIDEYITLIFTKVMDEFARGLIDEDEIAVPKDRNYWTNKATQETVALVDQMMELLSDIDSSLSLNYTKHYIGIKKDSRPYNFVLFKPINKRLNFQLKIPRNDDINLIIDKAELDTLAYDNRLGYYCLTLDKNEVKSKAETLKNLSELAYQHREKL